MPKLSIVVPIYNGEKYLRKCADSILSQNFIDFELVLVDDGSKDGSLEICYEYEKADSRVVVFHKENAGLVAARKSGVSIAKGDYIGFVDCDDYIDGDMYCELISTAEKDGSDIVAGGVLLEYKYSNSEAYHLISTGYYNKLHMSKYVFPKMLTYSGFVNFGIIPGVVVKIFKKEVLEKAFDKVSNELTIGEDVAITAHSFDCANSVSIIHSASYHYVQYEESMIHKFNSKRFDYVRNLYNCIMTVENEDYKKQIPLYISWLIFQSITECIKKSGYTKKEMKDYILNILNDDISKRCLKESDASKLSIKDKTKIFLMKHKMVCALMILMRG